MILELFPLASVVISGFVSTVALGVIYLAVRHRRLRTRLDDKVRGGT